VRYQVEKKRRDERIKLNGQNNSNYHSQNTDYLLHKPFGNTKNKSDKHQEDEDNIQPVIQSFSP
jgi:hypothetical protein